MTVKTLSPQLRGLEYSVRLVKNTVVPLKLGCFQERKFDFAF